MHQIETLGGDKLMIVILLHQTLFLVRGLYPTCMRSLSCLHTVFLEPSLPFKPSFPGHLSQTALNWNSFFKKKGGEEDTYPAASVKSCMNLGKLSLFF